MQYKRETGAILDKFHNIIHLVDGTPGNVYFPQEVLWDLHVSNPGSIFGFSHVHPPGFPDLSHEDQTTLKALCIAFYPWPVRFLTITEEPLKSYPFFFQESCFVGLLESKESWINRGKQGERAFAIIREWAKRMEFDDTQRWETGMNCPEFEPWYGDKLINKSYYDR